MVALVTFSRDQSFDALLGILRRLSPTDRKFSKRYEKLHIGIRVWIEKSCQNDAQRALVMWDTFGRYDPKGSLNGQTKFLLGLVGETQASRAVENERGR